MKKRTAITVDGSCIDCPFCQYRNHYPMSTGWDCRHPEGQRRIAGDAEIDRWELRKLKLKNGKDEEYEEHLAKYPLNIPPTCPLPDAEEWDDVLEFDADATADHVIDYVKRNFTLLRK